MDEVRAENTAKEIAAMTSVTFDGDKGHLLSALKDAERIISTSLRESQLRANTPVQKQNKFDADHTIGGIREAIDKAK